MGPGGDEGGEEGLEENDDGETRPGNLLTKPGPKLSNYYRAKVAN